MYCNIETSIYASSTYLCFLSYHSLMASPNGKVLMEYWSWANILTTKSRWVVHRFLSLYFMKDKLNSIACLSHFPMHLLKKSHYETLANLKNFDNRCCSIALEARLDDNLVTRLQLTWDSRTCLQFDYIMTLKKEAPMSSFYSLSKVDTFKPSTPTSFSKQYCAFNKVKWAGNIFSALNFNQYLNPYTTKEYLLWVLGWEISEPTPQWS